MYTSGATPSNLRLIMWDSTSSCQWWKPYTFCSDV